MRARDVSGKPRVLILNQYYWPGVEATAHLLSELAEALADEFEITVVTGMVAEADQPGVTERRGVRIQRVRSTAFDRSRLALRATNYLTYLGQSLWKSLRVDRPDVVLCMTDPPVIANIARSSAHCVPRSASTCSGPTVSSPSARPCASGSNTRARRANGSA